MVGKGAQTTRDDGSLEKVTSEEWAQPESG